MKNQETIFVFAITLLSLIYTAGFCAESIGLVEEKESGVINWANGTIKAQGISAPVKKDAGKSQTPSPKALSEAKNDARRKLLEAVKRIRVASKLSVGDIADRNKTILTQIKDMVYNAAEIEELRKYMSDGSVEVSLQMNLHGGFAQLILPKEIRQIETIKQFKSGDKSAAVKPKSSSEGTPVFYTGLLVDARSIEAAPALVPKLLDENLAEVFGPAFVSREYAVQNGMAAYHTDIPAAKADPRVVDHPLIVKALRTDWPSRCNIVISNSDASKLKSASDHLLFLKEARVVIVLSPR